MSIGKLGFSQEMREQDNLRYENSPTFTDDELEILKTFEEMCLKKGINEDSLLDKLMKYKK